MREIGDPAELAELFGRDRAAHAYGLADLEPRFWSDSRWFRRGDAAVGIVALGEGIVTVYAISPADPEGTLTLVVDLLDLMPTNTMITGPTGLATEVGRRRSIADLGVHVKCVLTRPGLMPRKLDVVDLGPADYAAVEALLATDPGAVFVLESMLADDSFVGVIDPGDSTRLVAVAGTHVVSDHYRVAAIGGVFVEPEARGHGLGARVTAGVCARIEGRVTTISLNVDADNVAARRTYERLGFTDCLVYEEVILDPA